MNIFSIVFSFSIFHFQVCKIFTVFKKMILWLTEVTSHDAAPLVRPFFPSTTPLILQIFNNIANIRQWFDHRRRPCPLQYFRSVCLPSAFVSVSELSRSRDPARLSTVEDALLSRSHDNNRTAEYHTPHLMEDLDKNLSTHLTSPKLAAPGSQANCPRFSS